jgi:hypothetical protein
MKTGVESNSFTFLKVLNVLLDLRKVALKKYRGENMILNVTNLLIITKKNNKESLYFLP